MGSRRGCVKPTTRSQKVLSSQKVVAKKPAGTKQKKREETIAMEQGFKVDASILDSHASRNAAYSRCTTAVANDNDMETKMKWSTILNAPRGKLREQALWFRWFKIASVGFVWESLPKSWF